MSEKPEVVYGKATARYAASYGKVAEVARQLQEKEGPYYEKWLDGMDAFIKSQGRGGERKWARIVRHWRMLSRRGC